MRRLSIVLVALLLAMSAPLGLANSSGKYKTASGCTCHYSAGSPTISENFPSDYNPGQTYTFNIGVSGGVTGTKGGFSLEVNKGTLSTGMGTMTVKVNSAGDSATHSVSNSRSWSVDWTAPNAGSGAVTVGLAVLAANGNSQNSGDAHTSASYTINELVTNSAPSVSNVMLTPDPANTLDSLTLSYSYNDPDGDQESGTKIHWYKDGIHQTSRNGDSTISSSLTAKGEDWQVKVTPSDGTDEGTEVSSNIVTIENLAPNIDSASISPATPNANDELTIMHTASDADSDSVTLSVIQWYRDGSHISGLDGENPAPSFATRDGEIWHAVITPNDGELDGQSYTIGSVTIGGENIPPVVSNVVISQSNTNTTGDITLSYSFADDDGDSQNGAEIHWFINDVLVTMHDDKTVIDSMYTSKGETWKATIKVSDGESWSTTETSNEVDITNTAPSAQVSINPDSPTINDDLILDIIFTDIDGDSSSGSQIGWYKDGVIVSELAGELTVPSSYTLGGEVWHVDYIPSDGEVSGSLTSAEITILNTAPVVDTSLSLNNGLELVIDATDPDGDSLQNTISWTHNGEAVSEYDDATTIPQSLLTGTDVWSASVSTTDGKAITYSNVSITIPNTNPVASASYDDSNSYIGIPLKITSTSRDIDGDSLTHSWIVYGTTFSGSSIEMIPTSTQQDILLRVRDSNGGVNTTILTINSVDLGTPELTIEAQGDEVLLSWTKVSTLVEYVLERDGEIIHQTSELTYTDKPFTSGEHSYRVLISLDGTIIDSSQSAKSIEISPDAAAKAEQVGEPSTILAVVFILFGLLSVLMASIGGGKE